jgi:Phage tail fibre adhesin Gp38
MAIGGSGAISLNTIATEFGGTTPHGINEYYRGGSYVSLNNEGIPTSGQIAFNQYYGTNYAQAFSLTVSSNTTGYNLRSALVSAGWNQTVPVYVVCTINSNVYVGSDSTSNPAFDMGGTFPAGSLLKLVNNGYILGRGGSGGTGGTTSSNPATAGGGGGGALSVTWPMRVENNNIIAGGGGGGGGGGLNRVDNPRGENDPQTYSYYSGGGGGGAGYRFGPGGGGQSASGSNGTDGYGGGGSGGSSGTTGGAGGSNGNAGGSGSGGNITGGAAGGGAGYAVSGNSNITWLATGTRTGGIS